jgi:hypothetical protein
LDKLVLGFEPPYWNYRYNGKGFCDIINDNLEILEIAKPYVYLNILNEQKEATFLTHQPKKWKSHTEKWLTQWVKIPYKIIYVNDIKEKLNYLNNGDYLIDDYPLFSCYDQVFLIDRLWNQEVKTKNRIFGEKDLRIFLKG